MNIKSQENNWKQKIGNRENGLSHHAFLVEGDISVNTALIRDFLESELDFIIAGNPDYFEFVYETFGIDNGRELKEMQSRHSFNENGKKIFIVGANSFTSEAQNSLLKVFEEPTEGTHFFVLTPSVQFILPTLLSRVVCIFSEAENSTDEITQYLKKSYSERLSYVLPLSKDSVSSKLFIENLTLYFYKKNPAEKRTSEISKILSLLILYRKYSYGRAPALKNMLEHLSLVAPRQ